MSVSTKFFHMCVKTAMGSFPAGGLVVDLLHYTIQIGRQLMSATPTTVLHNMSEKNILHGIEQKFLTDVVSKASEGVQVVQISIPIYDWAAVISVAFNNLGDDNYLAVEVGDIAVSYPDTKLPMTIRFGRQHIIDGHLHLTLYTTGQVDIPFFVRQTVLQLEDHRFIGEIGLHQVKKKSIIAVNMQMAPVTNGKDTAYAALTRHCKSYAELEVKDPANTEYLCYGSVCIRVGRDSLHYQMSTLFVKPGTNYYIRMVNVLPEFWRGGTWINRDGLGLGQRQCEDQDDTVVCVIPLDQDVERTFRDNVSFDLGKKGKFCGKSARQVSWI